MRSGVEPLPQELAATSDGPAKNSRKVTMLVAIEQRDQGQKRRIRNLSIVARVGWPRPWRSQPDSSSYSLVPAGMR